MPAKKTIAIQQLEDRLQPFRKLGRPLVPRGGWVRAIRQALGMTNRQLGQRVGRKANTIVELQNREALGTIQLNTLRELARALDCDLVYALVPHEPLDRILEERANLVARQTMRRIGHSMALERQALNEREQELAVQREIDRLLAGSRRKLWE